MTFVLLLHKNFILQTVHSIFLEVEKSNVYGSKLMIEQLETAQVTDMYYSVARL